MNMAPQATFGNCKRLSPLRPQGCIKLALAVLGLVGVTLSKPIVAEW